MDHTNTTADAIEVIGITLTAVGALVGFYFDRKRAIAQGERPSFAPVALTAAGALALFFSIAFKAVA